MADKQPVIDPSLVNPRVIEVYSACVTALQQVVRDHKISEDELIDAGRFFNRLGASGMFPSMLIASLAMTAIDVTRSAAGGTRQNLEGPFYKAQARVLADGNLLRDGDYADAPKMRLSGRVVDAASGAPLPGAELHFWQADHHGEYDNTGEKLRCIVIADAEGRYQLDTVVPLDYSAHDDDPIGELYRAMGRHNRRAAHIHLKAFAAGHVALTTQLFIAESRYIDNDYVEDTVSDDLLLHLKDDPAVGMPHARFDISLLPNHERATA